MSEYPSTDAVAGTCMPLPGLDHPLSEDAVSRVWDTVRYAAYERVPPTVVHPADYEAARRALGKVGQPLTEAEYWEGRRIHAERGLSDGNGER